MSLEADKIERDFTISQAGNFDILTQFTKDNFPEGVKECPSEAETSRFNEPVTNDAQLKAISGYLEPLGAEPSESFVSLLKNKDASMKCPLDSKPSINLTNCTVNIHTK